MAAMKILLGADFHGDFSRLEKLASKASLCICCGDIFGYHELPPDDFSFPLPFYSVKGNKELQRQERLEKTVSRCRNFYWLNDHLDELRSLTGIKFYGIDHGLKLEKVPVGTEVIISHQPAFGIADSCRDLFRRNIIDHCGSKEVRKMVEAVQPELLVAGHVHIHQEQQHGKTRAITLSPALVKPVFIEKSDLGKISVKII